jgi:hypothetical protein
MVVFFELAFFVVALGLIVVAETFGPRTSLIVTLALLALSFLSSRYYAAHPPEAEPIDADAPRATQTGVAQAALQEREALEMVAFHAEAARSWRHFNLLLLPLGALFVVWMLIAS